MLMVVVYVWFLCSRWRIRDEHLHPSILPILSCTPSIIPINAQNTKNEFKKLANFDSRDKKRERIIHRDTLLRVNALWNMQLNSSFSWLSDKLHKIVNISHRGSWRKRFQLLDLKAFFYFFHVHFVERQNKTAHHPYRE